MIFESVGGDFPALAIKDKPIYAVPGFHFRTNIGVACGTRDLRGDYGSVFSFTGQGIKKSPRTDAVFKYAIPHLSEILRRLPGGKEIPQTPSTKLSKREIEVLQWIKEGKTSYEASVILNISERTVNFHVRNILEKLDVMNRVQAVATALKRGIIGW